WNGGKRRQEHDVRGGGERCAKADPGEEENEDNRHESGSGKKVVTLPQKRKAVEVMVVAGLSERRSCEILNLARTTMRYARQMKDDAELRERVRSIAHSRSRFGYRRITAKLREKGGLVKHKR